jgi:hypothetical protein
MLKKFALVVLTLVPALWAQDSTAATTAGSNDERSIRKQWEEEQRLDEYANSLRRRDWLKDRLILGPGLGSKYSMMGKEGFGFGVAAEYITSWHLAPYLSYGIAFKRTDPSFDTLSLQGSSGGRVGLSYYFFPKSPLHLAISVSYGNIYYDHMQRAGDSLAYDTSYVEVTTGETIIERNTKFVEGTQRKMIKLKGWEFDMCVSYLTNEWYFLNFVAGMYYAGNKLPGTENKSTTIDDEGKVVGLAMGAKKVPDTGLVFGLGIGFALPDMFPDDTEVRRRDREAKRKN